MKTFYSICEYIAGAIFNIVFIVLAVLAIYVISNQAYAFGKNLFVENNENAPYAEYTITIPEGTDAMAIGKILEDNNLTKNAWIFWLQSRLNGTYKLFKSGTYTFTSQMETGEIMDIMQRAQFSEVNDLQITIPEGLSLRQIGELCESKELFTTEEFLAACEEFENSYFFLDLAYESGRANPLEGYLFPDTYRLPKNPEPIDLISRMLTRFQEIFDYEMEEQAEQLGRSIDEIMIIASIIEKEIKVDSERALCSSIIYNRLKASQRLEMCSTVLYILDKRKDRLLLSDLEVVSPYNTYRNDGLPIGPICNPGKAAIVAALNPANTNYFYMVVSDEEKGEHFFTHDYNEFLEAKERYNQQF